MPHRRLAPRAPLSLLLLTFTLSLASAQDEPPPAPTPPPRPQSGGADPSDDAFEMGSPPSLADGLAEEDMWPAATAEGWARPCLVQWQRSFDDAMRVARAENRPVMVAVNMDGEIASEHFAGVRYREVETAALLSRYACVIASVYRHTPRDYDEEGRRVECPRFGTVTCGEHVEAERELYDKYFDGRRVAPRHIVLDLEGTETYDVYYSWDTDSVIKTYVKGVEGWPDPVEPVDPSLEDLAKSADVEHRLELERRYREGEREMRIRILETLRREHVVDQTEVLREAIFGLDLELATLARKALAQCGTEGALDLMAESLKAPLESSERELLLDAVERMAESSPRARTLYTVHSGLALDSTHIDTAALAREYEANVGTQRDLQARDELAVARPEDPAALLELAEGLLERAQQADGRFAELAYEDARRAALEAESLGASGARLDAVLALASDGLGERDAARRRALAAIEAGALATGDELPESALLLDKRSKARLLLLFADARQRAIRQAYRQGEAWPPEWLSDVTTAYSSLPEGALADPNPLVDHYDFLRWIGATPRADAVLDQALLRFPDSPELHDRLRGRLLWEGGAEALEREYAERLARAEDDWAKPDARPTRTAWFAGYASLVAAEQRRRRNELDDALASYTRAMAHFQRDVELFPDGRDTSLHFIALARAGQARVELERGELAAATSDLLEALRVRPDSAASQDGLGLSPIMTARMLKARLADAGDEQRAALVQAALDALDPKLLEPPPSERPPLDRSARRGPPRSGGR